MLSDTKFDCLSFCWSGFQIVFWEQNCLEVGCRSVSHTTSFSLQFSKEGALFSQPDWPLQQLAEHFTSIIQQVLAVEFNLELTTV